MHNGGGIQKSKNGEWGYRKISSYTDEGGTQGASVELVTFTARKSGGGNSKSSWLKGAFDWLNSTWMGRRGTDYEKGKSNYRKGEYGEVLQTAGGESREGDKTQFIGANPIEIGPLLNNPIVGSPGVSTGVLKIDDIVRYQFNFNDIASAAQSFNDFLGELNKDKPLLKVNYNSKEKGGGISIPDGYKDTNQANEISKKWSDSIMNSK